MSTTEAREMPAVETAGDGPGVPTTPSASDRHDDHDGASLERHAMKAVELGAIQDRARSCARLWYAVIAQAVDDLAYARRCRGRSLTAAERRRLRFIQQNPPAEFFENGAFDHVCRQMGLDPGALWRQLGLSDLGIRRRRSTRRR